MAKDLVAVLSADTSQLQKSLNDAKTTLSKYSKQSAQLNGVSKEQVNAFNKTITALNHTINSQKTATQQTKALEKQLINLTFQYSQLSETAKQSDFGRAMANTINQTNQKLETLNNNILRVKSSMSGFSSGNKLDFAKMSGQISQLTNTMSGLGVQGASSLSTIASMGTKLANPYVAGAAAVAGATTAFIKYNIELEKTLDRTEQITGLSGASLNSLRNGIQSVADTWGKDYNDVLAQTDTMMNQFGISGETALKLIRDGLVAGADESGRMFDMIQQYAGAFNDAGISAEEFVAIMGNTRSGLFNEEGMQLITLASKNIRLMSDSAVKSLTAIGINADEMKSKLADGSMTTVQAIQQISAQLKQLNPQSQEVGKVLQDVFGKKGSAAGTEVIGVLSELETNLDKVKQQTGEQGKAIEEVQKADRNLQNALQSLFGTSEKGWSTMGNQLKSEVYNGLAKVINAFIDLYNKSTLVRGAWATFVLNFRNSWNVIKTTLKLFVDALKGVAGIIEGIVNLDIEQIKSSTVEALKAIGQDLKSSAKKYQEDIQSALDTTMHGHIDVVAEVDEVTTGAGTKKPVIKMTGQVDKVENNKKTGSGSGSSSSTVKVEAVKGSLSDLENQLSDLQKKYKDGLLKITPDDYEKQVKDLQQKIEEKKVELKLATAIPEGSLADVEKKLSDLNAKLKVTVDEKSKSELITQIQDLTKRKEEIEITLKPIVDEKQVKDVQRNITNHVTEKSGEVDFSTNNPSAFDKSVNDVNNLKSELKFYSDIEKSLQKQYDLIVKKQELGGILTKDEEKLKGIYETNQKNLLILADNYSVAVDKASQLQLNQLKENALDSTINALGMFSSSIQTITGDIKTLTDDSASGLDKLSAGFQLVADTASTVSSTIRTVAEMTEMMQAVNDAATAKSVANSTAKTGANVSEAMSSGAAALGESAKSGASMPFPLNIAAIAAGVAAVTGVIATIVSLCGAFKDGGIVPKFADGGVFKGATTLGDYNLAAVNGGEMILNGKQQSRLFRLLNGSGSGLNNSMINGEVEFKIKGDTLIGVQKNYIKKHSRL